MAARRHFTRFSLSRTGHSESGKLILSAPTIIDLKNNLSPKTPYSLPYVPERNITGVTARQQVKVGRPLPPHRIYALSLAP